MLENMMSKEIQVGVDIATSLTIIAAVVSWYFESRRRQRVERRIGISEQAKSTSLHRILEFQSEFETHWMNLIDSAQKFERQIDRRVSIEKGLEPLNEAISSDPRFLDERLEELNSFRDYVGVYYEAIQARRYTLFPVISSLGDGVKYLEVVKSDIKEISVTYNSLGSKWEGLIHELRALTDYVSKTYQGGDEDDEAYKHWAKEDEELERRIVSIILDPDYYDWLKNFVKDEDEEKYRKILNKEYHEDDANALLNQVFFRMAIGIRKDPWKYVAHILVLASREVQLARQACKDILIKLAAISHILLSNTYQEFLEEVVKKFESEEYFDQARSIR